MLADPGLSSLIPVTMSGSWTAQDLGPPPTLPQLGFWFPGLKSTHFVLNSCFLLCWPTKVLSSIRDSRKSWRCALLTEGKRDPTKACVHLSNS